MPPRSLKMNRFIFGFQRRAWLPKLTPASRRSFMETTGMDAPFWFGFERSVRASVETGRAGPPPPRDPDGSRGLRRCEWYRERREERREVVRKLRMGLDPLAA